MKEKLQKLNLDINRQENNHAGFVALFLVNEIKENPKNGLADFEMALREMNSRVHLIAIPLESYGKFEGKTCTTFYPTPGADYKPYGLWVSMNGKAEAEETMKKHDLTEIDNLVRLHNCGFLTLKE